MRKTTFFSIRIFHTVIIIKGKLFKVRKIVLLFKALNNLMMMKMILMFSTLIKIILTITKLFSRKSKISKIKLKDNMKQQKIKIKNQIILFSRFFKLIKRLRINKVISSKVDGVRMNTTDFWKL